MLKGLHLCVTVDSPEFRYAKSIMYVDIVLYSNVGFFVFIFMYLKNLGINFHPNKDREERK